RPIGLVPEDGKSFDPALLSVPISTWANDVTGSNCAPATMAKCRLPAMADVERRLADARAAVLELDWKTGARKVAEAALILHDIVHDQNAGGSDASGLTPDQLEDFFAIEAHADKALAMIANLDLTAEASRSNLVLGEPVSVTTSSRCRPEVDCKLASI